jgi:xanthine/CO dehydrogenase XdhC/CoxF family maturation factor
MRELDEILAAARGAPDAVLATVVHVQGSAYRRPGARLLLLPDGRRIGSVSGGCLESDVARKAWWLTNTGRPAVRIYDTRSDDDAVFEFGLGCQGVVHVLFERLRAPGTQGLLNFLASARSARRGAAVATAVAGPRLGERVFFDGALTADRSWPEAVACAREAFTRQKSFFAHAGETDLFVEWIGPPPSVVIFGAGHDAVPLVATLAQLGWHVTVADGRPAYAQAARLPGADRVVLLPSRDPAASIEFGREALVLLMTHDYALDARLLPGLAARRPAYLGVLGPAARMERLRAETGVTALVHAPAGLDIGAETPEGIALAIAAEMQAVIAGRAGGMLRHRQSKIYDPVEEAGVACAAEPPRESPICEVA